MTIEQLKVLFDREESRLWWCVYLSDGKTTIGCVKNNVTTKADSWADFLGFVPSLQDGTYTFKLRNSQQATRGELVWQFSKATGQAPISASPQTVNGIGIGSVNPNNGQYPILQGVGLSGIQGVDYIMGLQHQIMQANIAMMGAKMSHELELMKLKHEQEKSGSKDLIGFLGSTLKENFPIILGALTHANQDTTKSIPETTTMQAERHSEPQQQPIGSNVEEQQRQGQRLGEILREVQTNFGGNPVDTLQGLMNLLKANPMYMQGIKKELQQQKQSTPTP